MTYSANGTQIATASDDDTARIWDAHSGRELLRVRHEDHVRNVAFSPDGSELATASDDGTARVWDVRTGQELARLQHDNQVRTVAFSPEGTRLITGSNDGTARIWDLSMLKLDTATLARQICQTLGTKAKSLTPSEIAADPALGEVYSSAGQDMRDLCATLPP